MMRTCKSVVHRKKSLYTAGVKAGCSGHILLAICLHAYLLAVTKLNFWSEIDSECSATVHMPIPNAAHRYIETENSKCVLVCCYCWKLKSTTTTMAWMHARHIPEDLLLGILDFFIEKHEGLDIVSGFLDGVRT